MTDTIENGLVRASRMLLAGHLAEQARQTVKEASVDKEKVLDKLREKMAKDLPDKKEPMPKDPGKPYPSLAQEKKQGYQVLGMGKKAAADERTARAWAKLAEPTALPTIHIRANAPKPAPAKPLTGVAAMGPSILKGLNSLKPDLPAAPAAPGTATASGK